MSWNYYPLNSTQDERSREIAQIVSMLIFISIVLVFQMTLTFLNINYLLILILSLGLIFGSNVNIFLFGIEEKSQFYYDRPFIHPWFLQILNMFQPEPLTTDVYVNVAGGLVPIAVASILAVLHPTIIIPAILLSLFLIIIINRLAIITNYGVVMPVIIVPILGLLGGAGIGILYILIGIPIVLTNIAMIAYLSVTISILIGADLLNLGKLHKIRSNGLSIGGAGIFDGIFLSGLLTLIFILF